MKVTFLKTSLGKPLRDEVISEDFAVVSNEYNMFVVTQIDAGAEPYDVEKLGDAIIRRFSNDTEIRLYPKG